MIDLKRLAIALTTTVLTLPAIAQQVVAASFIHEYSDRATLEAACIRKGGQSVALVELTQQFGYVDLVSLQITAPDQTSARIEQTLPVEQIARVGYVFPEGPSSITFNGAFWGVSVGERPIRYDIPAGTTAKCD
ncbi:hypothetical protein S7335_1006 [Synechococcus sp. PCC 7335]|uniref:hypothetical protein n=1 Tax=Synechococcus sp. (strain ATCC 29403 / PCC 7335) TaxID=91464 RepID=UPI00017EC81B|nr:hypothetical protein [Synechococcus sp. PCC 7335]EDX82704.1 hypothetical protein S7335_1006 [Synechococcus sp. PCC 7335]